MSDTPMRLPDNFNPATNMISRSEGNRLYHAPRAAFELAANLLANGTPQDISQAAAPLGAAPQGATEELIQQPLRIQHRPHPLP